MLQKSSVAADTAGAMDPSVSTRRTWRGRAAVVAALALLAGAVVTAAPSPAGAWDATPGPTVSPDVDYATEQFADPWDFSNIEDFRGDGTAHFLSSWSLSSGTLKATTIPGAGMILAHTFPGVLPHDRDTKQHPIDAARYTQISFSLYSSAATTGGFFWYSCDGIVASCEQGTMISISQGWRVYTVNLPTAPRTNGGLPAWSGRPAAIRLVPSLGSNTTVELDWFRLRSSSASASPPATTPPRPVLDAPHRVGGVDYATAVRGDAWDMSQPSDVAAVANAAWRVEGGQMIGRSTGPVCFDPGVTLPLAAPIDTARWHRLSFAVTYDGPFSLAEGVGGGMVARLLWHRQGLATWQVSQDIVVYPGRNDITIDLATVPVTAVNEPDLPGGVGWTGLVDAVRFDPDEDSGCDAQGRTFVIDEVRIAEDPVAYANATDIVFHDTNFAAGTTAAIYADTDATGYDGTLLASGIPVSAGRNSYRWAPGTPPTGARWVYVELTRGGVTTRTYATAPITFSSAPSPAYGVMPRGSLDSFTVDGTGLRATGWALDPERAGAIDVHLYLDGVGRAVSAGGDRPDIAAAFPGLGSAHGFDTSWTNVADGDHTLCAYAINVGLGSNVGLGCRTATVRRSPFGYLDTFDLRLANLRIGGWAIDPDATQPTAIHVYVDGVGHVLTADGSRPDVGAVFPGAGANHGFAETIALAPGPHSLCVYAINQGLGTNTPYGCRSIAVGASPVGWLDVVGASLGTLRVRGWAIDPETTAALDVHLYVDGVGRALRASDPRPDVDAYFGYGAAHGFDTTQQVSGGTHSVCLYAINVGAGANLSYGCRTIDVPADPLGILESVTRVGSTVQVRGWAIDADTTGSIDTHVYVNGTGQRVVASTPRADLATIWPAYGPNHGLAVDVAAPVGPASVCVYAINVGPGGSRLLGCRTV